MAAARKPFSSADVQRLLYNYGVTSIEPNVADDTVTLHMNDGSHVRMTGLQGTAGDIRDFEDKLRHAREITDRRARDNYERMKKVADHNMLRSKSDYKDGYDDFNKAIENDIAYRQRAAAAMAQTAGTIGIEQAQEAAPGIGITRKQSLLIIQHQQGKER